MSLVPNKNLRHRSDYPDIPNRIFVGQSADLKAAVRRLFALLDVVEESDNGRVFHPTTIGTCRAASIAELDAVLTLMRRLSAEEPKEQFTKLDVPPQPCTLADVQWNEFEWDGTRGEGDAV